MKIIEIFFEKLKQDLNFSMNKENSHFNKDIDMCKD